MTALNDQARALVAAAAQAAAGAANEAGLRQHIEQALEAASAALMLPWMPFQLEVTLRGRASQSAIFADVAHGAVVIEYEPPRCFRGGGAARKVRHAQEQAEQYVERLAVEEGRDQGEYVMVAWDGSHIAFGKLENGSSSWESLRPFDEPAARRLLERLRDDGVPLVHPRLLTQLVGPTSSHGRALVPVLFDAIRDADDKGRSGITSKSYLLLVEWRRLFAQVVGVEATQRLTNYLRDQGTADGLPYGAHPDAYLFALNSYLALVAKLTAALALPSASQNVGDPTVDVKSRLGALESGALFHSAGVSNFLVGDFFSWLTDDPAWPKLKEPLSDLIDALAGLDFDITRKSPRSVRDLFKGLYESFVPRELRHALGEFYTPDWMASHLLGQVGWNPDASLTDPACGTGTFLLEALRLRREGAGPQSPHELLQGLNGLDLNPIAVLAARASLLVALAGVLDPSRPVTLPVYLADSMNPAMEDNGFFGHTVQTELGDKQFRLPVALVRDSAFLPMFLRMRELIETGMSTADVTSALRVEGLLAALNRDAVGIAAVSDCVGAIRVLHDEGWNGIWCAILADRFAASAILPAQFVVGNPPWVKWSNLPDDYATFLKPRLEHLGLLSDASYVGGIESDISTVVLFEAADRWLAIGGRLAMYITATVFETPSSQGFRRFRIESSNTDLCVESVEDFGNIKPFAHVTNRPALLILTKGRSTKYPVPFKVWSWAASVRSFDPQVATASDFGVAASAVTLYAEPVPGTDAGPWLRASKSDIEVARMVLGAGSNFVGRNGVTTDRNGIFYVRVRRVSGGIARVRNDPRGSGSRTPGVPEVEADVEAEHVFPLLRGAGITAWRATPDPDFRILVPQQTMHGDRDLPTSAPGTHRFLSRFRSTLESRGSLRRYQQDQVYWSLWNVGPYTFKPYKVAWREFCGQRFEAALVPPFDDPVLRSKRPVVPNNKVYFVGLDDESEAAYLCAFLNAPAVAMAISAYAARLSLGTSPVAFTSIPDFSPGQTSHARLADLGLQFAGGAVPTANELEELNELVVEAKAGS